MPRLASEDPLAIAAIRAVETGDTQGLKRLLNDYPDLVNARVVDGKAARTLLHVAADWPGQFPNGPETVATLISYGADPNPHFEGTHAETPLHWAASSDDVAVLDALLDGGADIGAPGSIFANGTAIADAVAFGQWRVARRLLERGARTNLWQAAGLGLRDRLSAYFAADPRPTGEQITQAFWLACHGGQIGTAEYLLERGADLNWIGYDGLTPLDAAARSHASELVEWLKERGPRSAKDTQPK